MTASLFDRLVARPRPWWVYLLIGLALFLLPFGATILDGVMLEFIKSEQWRVFLLAPAEILYILLIAPPLSRTGERVLRSFRSVVRLDDGQFNQLVAKTSQSFINGEVIAIAFGVLLTPLLIGGYYDPKSWLWYYWLFSSALMYGILAWCIYGAFVNTRLTSALHKQPLEFNLFDPAPFEAVGKQSLVLALVFIGGITISLLFSVRSTSIRAVGFWLSNIPIVLVTFLVFFLNMFPTHKVLSARKASELAVVQDHIQHLGQVLLQQLSSDEDLSATAAQINALAVYEQRLQKASTWPYDTGMLSTVFFSILVPAITLLAKLAFELIF